MLFTLPVKRTICFLNFESARTSLSLYSARSSERSTSKTFAAGASVPPGGVSAAAAATSADSRSESAATFAAAPKPRAIAPTHIVIGSPTTTNRTQTQTGVFFFSVVTTSGRQDAPPETSTGRQAKHGRRSRVATSGFAPTEMERFRALARNRRRASFWGLQS